MSKSVSKVVNSSGSSIKIWNQFNDFCFPMTVDSQLVLLYCFMLTFVFISFNPIFKCFCINSIVGEFDFCSKTFYKKIFRKVLNSWSKLLQQFFYFEKLKNTWNQFRYRNSLYKNVQLIASLYVCSLELWNKSHHSIVTEK